VLVVLFQLRITRWTAGWPTAPKLAFAMTLMGFPFLLLLGGGPVPLLVTVIVIFVIGEMLWIPTSQALAAEMAPEAVRGAYMGALGTSGSVAWMLGPLAGLEIRAAAGNTGTWIFFAALALAGAAAGAGAARAAAAGRVYPGRRAIQTVSSPPP